LLRPEVRAPSCREEPPSRWKKRILRARTAQDPDATEEGSPVDDPEREDGDAEDVPDAD
jgi:hypothetical protein